MSQFLAKSFRDKNGVDQPQIVYYNAGVGTESTWWGRHAGGALGVGLDEDVCEIYNFLAINYEEGDELFFFGFSRGAFTARAAAGLVCRVGLCETYMLHRFWEMYAVYQTLGPEELIENSEWVKSPHPESEAHFWLNVRGEMVPVKKGSGQDWFTDRYADNVSVKVVGVWDTVGALGIPSNTLWDVTTANQKYGFHDTRLNVKDVWKSHIENAFHALALDEHRASFPPTLWTLPADSDDVLIQCWFPGVHINVGGGNKDSIENKLSDLELLANITFAWMVDRCAPFLKFDSASQLKTLNLYVEAAVRVEQEYQTKMKGNSLGRVVDSLQGIYKTGGSTIRTPGAYFLDDPTKRLQLATNECIHPVVWLAKQEYNYRLTPLDGFERVVGPGGGHYFTKSYTPKETLYLMDKTKAVLAFPYRYFFPGKKKESPKIVVNLPEFVIPAKLSDDPELEHLESWERGLIIFAYRARTLTQNRNSPAAAKVSDAEAQAYLATIDKANGNLVKKQWSKIARREFPPPLKFLTDE
ncbi:hypothetical protein MHUMG1_09042 [Metarhizium humberi]|uniref:T6SS Phospholipase effector Tle1-like catalytic domain-containing protein n=1 Tax=Metarhizium humberi TaxID=2596975 RepID=A0A9P8M770_9HYPO|nr:hypothetical protein MHUMG1_09042 [Metarhizium humberi]